MSSPKKGSRGHKSQQSRNTAQSRDGRTRNDSQVVRGSDRFGQAKQTEQTGQAGQTGQANRPNKPNRPKSQAPRRQSAKAARMALINKENKDNRDKDGDKRDSQSSQRSQHSRHFSKSSKHSSRFRSQRQQVQLDAPPKETVFKDRDGQEHRFADSNLKRIAAQILNDKRKKWRYRAFDFPLFSERGHEQSFHFDFYVYDAEDAILRLILVIPFESREVWDKIGRFKRQYPMYHYELWTPEKLAKLSKPRAVLGF